VAAGQSIIMFLFASRTKIFIRFPRTLFATEDAFEFSKHQLGMITLFVPPTNSAREKERTTLNMAV
jgi:hypothetical protein